MRISKIHFLVFILSVISALFVSQSVIAAESVRQGGYVVFDPVLTDSTVLINADGNPPEEPNIITTTFYKIPDVSTVEQRIDRLLQGIAIEIPPEYDHFGYEIRRYMSRVGNTKIYDEDKRLIEEIANVRKARVIVTYWQKFLDKEMKEIDALLLDKKVNQATLTTYKQNKSTVRSFLVSLQGWVDANDRFLTDAYEKSAMFENYYPEIIFVTQTNDIVDFYNNFLLKQTKLRLIRRYPPFALMVY